MPKVEKMLDSYLSPESALSLKGPTLSTKAEVVLIGLVDNISVFSGRSNEMKWITPNFMVPISRLVL